MLKSLRVQLVLSFTLLVVGSTLVGHRWDTAPVEGRRLQQATSSPTPTPTFSFGVERFVLIDAEGSADTDFINITESGEILSLSQPSTSPAIRISALMFEVT